MPQDAKHYQPATTDAIREAQRAIRGMLGEIPGGCELPPISMGAAPKVCPWLVYCEGLEAYEAVLCELVLEGE